MGRGDLWVWKADGGSEIHPIRVEQRVYDEKNLPLERALGKLNEAEVIFSGQGVILRGEIQSLIESAKISALVEGYPKFVYNETLLAEGLLNDGERKLDEWLKQIKYSDKLRIEKSGNNLWLRGHVERPSELPAFAKQAKGIFPPLHVELDSLPDYAPTVHFKVFLLELKKTQFSSLGISWPGSVPGVFQISMGGIQDFMKIDLAIQQLEGNGNAKILSNPELVVRAPGEAELFAGGELPIQSQNRFFSNLTWKNYGLTLRLKVTQCAGDRVRLEIYTEVSHLDPTLATEKIPGIQANRMKTQVDARFGSPLFLSGLLQQGIREEARGLPFLRSIPVLGTLFGSTDYLNERSELVAILYPHATPPKAPPETLTTLAPRGPLPVPRNWITPQEERALRESKEYPWNVLN